MKFNILFGLLLTPVLLFQSPTIFGQEKAGIKEVANTIEDATLGSTVNVHKFGNLFFGGQFSAEDLPQISKEGITRIITLRTEGEVDWDEKKEVQDANIEFVEVPFRSPDALTDEVFTKVRNLLKDKSKKTLLHCGSANRVGGVWLPFRVLDEDADLETAIQEAQQIGLRTPFIKEKALDYIHRMQKEMQAAGDGTGDGKSVKPGINKAFVSPDLDVDKYIKIFEIESRDVFVSRNNIVAACGIQKGDVVADIGAGTGLFTRMFSAEVGIEGLVYAVDISPRFLDHIHKESQKNKILNITNILCAENSVNLPPNSIDVAFVCDTYHHFEYPLPTMRSVYRALKKDGRLIVIDFERIPGKTRDWLMEHVRAGKEVFRTEVQEAGFILDKEIKVEGLQENYFLIFRKN